MTAVLVWAAAVATVCAGGWWFLWELPARRRARRAVAGIRCKAETWLA